MNSTTNLHGSSHDAPGQSCTRPAIDRDFVADLIQSIGFADYLEITCDLQRDVEEQITAMTSKAEVGDIDGVKHAVHKISGMLSQFGATDVVTVCEDVWDSCDHVEIMERIACFTRAARAVLVELDVIRRNSSMAWN